MHTPGPSTSRIVRKLVNTVHHCQHLVDFVPAVELAGLTGAGVVGGKSVGSVVQYGKKAYVPRGAQHAEQKMGAITAQE